MKLADVAVTQQERNGLTAAAGPPLVPSRSWFEREEPDEVVGWTVTADGQVYGHAATWGQCHTGKPGRCVTPPKSRSGYAYYTTGLTEVDDGELIPTGRITLGTGHASLTASPAATAEHYDNTGAVVADVSVKDGKHGIWVTGALRPNVSPERIRELRGAALSGDWRSIRGALEMLGLLAVNVPGFPVPRAMTASGADDEVLALVAAGMLTAEDLAMEVADMSDEAYDAELDALYASSKQKSDGYMDRKRKVAEVMREFKAGKLKNADGEKVTDRRAALAIALKSDGLLPVPETLPFAYETLTEAAFRGGGTFTTGASASNASSGVTVTLAAAGTFDESKHPRHKKGEKDGGKFAPKGGAGGAGSGNAVTEGEYLQYPPYRAAVDSLSERYAATYTSARQGGADANAAHAEALGELEELELQEFFAEDELYELFPDVDPESGDDVDLQGLVEQLADDAERRAKKVIELDSPEDYSASGEPCEDCEEEAMDPSNLPAAKGEPHSPVDGDVPAASLTASMRAAAAERGEAMPDGKFVIRNRTDLAAAITASAGAPTAEVCGWIATRAAELGVVGDLPAAWDLEALTAAGFFDPAKHPRHPAGKREGGRFAPKVGDVINRHNDNLGTGERVEEVTKEDGQTVVRTDAMNEYVVLEDGNLESLQDGSVVDPATGEEPWTDPGLDEPVDISNGTGSDAAGKSQDAYYAFKGVPGLEGSPYDRDDLIQIQNAFSDDPFDNQRALRYDKYRGGRLKELLKDPAAKEAALLLARHGRQRPDFTFPLKRPRLRSLPRGGGS